MRKVRGRKGKKIGKVRNIVEIRGREKLTSTMKLTLMLGFGFSFLCKSDRGRFELKMNLIMNSKLFHMKL